MARDGQNYVYRKIKDSILLQPLGIASANGIFKASPERALCDKIYLDRQEYFDNLRSIDWDFMTSLNQNVYNDNRYIALFIKENRP
jgi:hypothetical protein